MDHAEKSPRVPSRGSFDTASLLGTCGWWPPPTSVVTTTNFAGCGVTAISDPFSRTSICSRSRASSSHLSLSQPRRSIHDSQQVTCKTTSLPTPDIQSPQIPNTISVITTENEVLAGKTSENSSIVNNVASTLPTVLSIPVISPTPIKSKKLDASKNSTLSVSLVPQKSTRRRKKTPKDPNAVDHMKNGKRARSSNNRHKLQANKKPKEKSAKHLSSDTESHGESTSSSSGVDSSSGAATASTASSDSTDEEEREKQQQELARLKRQQKELRRKVQELKQASQESSQQKVDAQVKKTPLTPKSSPRTVNHTTKKPVPSPAHSSSAMAISPKSFPQKPKHNLCSEDDANMSVPLDLCVKKQEPTFEVTSSSILSSPHITMATMAKKQLQAMAFHQQVSGKLQTPGPKRRGRKPKALSTSNILPPDMAHQLKQNNVKDLNSMGLPQKLLLPPSNNARNSDANSQKKNVNSVNPSKSVLLMPGELSNSLSSPRKIFTLDSLLSESNGTLDFGSSPNDIDLPALILGSRNSKNKERMRYSNRIKRIEEKSKDFNLSAKNESSSATDSELDNDHSDSEESTLGNNSTSTGHKRSYDEDGEDFSNKKRRVIPDEREVQIPLEHGWRRETKVRCFSRSGVRGEVTYYSPCGKKLRSYPEVIRYLIKNGITVISRDNFTFSTKVIVGEFLECTPSGTGEGYVHLNEHEVAARINELRSRKGRMGNTQNRKSQLSKMSDQDEQQRLWEQKQMQHQLEQQEISRQAREAKVMGQHQREQALIAARIERKLKAEESRRQKEQQRVLKQQERFERMEQQRIEREIRAQQLLEDQEMKRQQAAFLREQERERRRQHMILVRALETRKKQEERERKREEMLYEKRMNKEKKIEQRRIELDYLRELKKPVEDMMLKDNVPLPTLNRIPGLKLSAKAFADILLVFEFLHNFGETLGFDSDSLPTLNTLQMALLNLDEKLEEELLSVVHHLLVCAIDDPGVPHCSESATVLGQNLKDADVTNNNVSEVLRLYFTAQDKRNIMCQWLHAKPFLSLNSTQKAEILAHVCNDLLGSRVLMRKVDSNIENVNVLRKDKWLIEGDLRRLKTVQQRRLLKARQLTYEENKLNVSGNNAIPTDTSSVGSSNNVSKDDQSIADPSLKNAPPCDKDKLDDLDNDNESGNDSDDTQAQGIASDADDEDLQLSNEELTKKVDKLSKQLTCYSNKLTKALHTIRGCTFGQDRYHRRYWVLPKSGGIFIESLESSTLPEYQESILAVQDIEENCDKTDANIDIVEIKKEIDCSVETKDGEINDVEMKEPNSSVTKDDYEQMEIPENENVLKNNDLAEEQKDETCIKKEPENIMEAEKDEDKEISQNSDDTCTEEIKTDNEQVKDTEFSDVKKEGEDSIMSSGSPKDESATKGLSSDTETEIDQKPTIELEKPSQKKKVKERHHKYTEKKSLNDALDKKADVNIFMPKFCDNAAGLESSSLNHTVNNSSERKPPPNPSIPGNQNWILHSPFFASLLAGNMLFNGPGMPGRETNGTYFNLPKSDSNNPFGPFLGIGQSGLLSPEQVFKSLNEKPGNQKPWFSILPRMPCDEDSLPKSHCAKNPFSSSLLYTPPNLLVAGSTNSSKSPSHPTHSTPVTSSSGQGQLSNLQMEILNGMPPGFFLHPFLPPQFGAATFQGNMPVNNNTSPNPFSSNMPHSGTISDFTLNLGHPPESSTPSSIPTPSATPGPNSQGCGTPTYRDSPSPSFAKKFMMEKLTQEYEKPKPIPFVLQRGWWRITDPSQLKDIVNALHHRGIREKMLQKQLQKHFNYASISCTQGTDKDTDLEITDIDRKTSELPGGVPLANNAEEWSRDVALRVDLAILEQIENLEEKIDGASMQVKGWKPPPKLSVEPVSKFIPACELYLQVKCDITDSPRERNPKKLGKKNARKKKAEARKRALEAEAEAAAEKTEEVSSEIKPEEGEADDKQEVSALEVIKENLDETTTNSEEIGKDGDLPLLPPGKINPVEEGKNRLLMVEAAIERRYLKPPLGFSSNDLNRSVSGGSREIYDNGEDEPIPVGLHKWRNSVNLCRSSSQLAMCLNYLENYTAWDKSIMRASCQFCHSGENEEMLLLCDGCDKGYHTYCFKPKMEKIPDGDWYCYECLNKATGDNVCVICGKKGRLIECSSCPKCFHIICLEPPLGKIPKGKWFCSGCSHTRPKKSSKKSSVSKDREKDKEKEKEQKEPSSCKKSDNSPAVKPKVSDRKDKKDKNRSQLSEDLAACIAVVDEMEKHDDSWPFLTPVNTKQFPTYRKVIKKPMDLTTVRSKLDSNQYKSKEDFAADVRLIFDNCETFNEDDSPVGQAGHTMRAFFDSRWAELCNT